MDTVKYDDIKDTLKTGDIILFSGQYEMSKLVQTIEDSKWSHVAMVMRLPEYDFPLLYEATDLVNLPDLLHNDYITGPKVVDLKKRLETYGDDLVPYKAPVYSIRRLEKPLPADSSKKLKDLLNELHGLPNPSSLDMVLGTLLGRYLHIKSDSKSITCSGFIALTYEHLGLIKGDMPINGYAPKDFSTDGDLKLINNSLSNEILIEL